MNRLAQLLHCPRHGTPLVVFRWLLLVMAYMSIGMLMWTKSWPGLSPLLALAYATLYLMVWTTRLPVLAIRNRGSIALLTTDFVLSLTAAWIAGVWGYAMTPFVLGALVLPGVLFGTLGASVAVACYLVTLLLYRSLHLPPGVLWGGSLALEYAKAMVAAFIWPVSLFLQRRWPAPAHRTLRLAPPRTDPPLLPAVPPPIAPATRFGTRLLPEQSAARRSTDGPQSTTLERRATRLHTAVRQVVAEVQQQGLTIGLSVEGREPAMPAGYVTLLVKAIEIALDNIRQHAHVTVAEIQIINTPALIYLHVRDHGTGLLDGTSELPGFHHLKLLRYQLQELGGTLKISEPDDDGVLFAVTLPIMP